MGKRSTGRKLAMQALYQIDIAKADDQTVLDSFFSDFEIMEPTLDWATYLTQGVLHYREELDGLIRKYAIDWDINRISLVDKNILRVAFYELLHTETPHTVVINEAIEISKKFSSDDSPKFINGILGMYIKTECSQA